MRETFYASPFYALFLMGRSPNRLELLPHDQWPGDIERGHALLRGEFAFNGQLLRIAPSGPTPADWEPSAAGPAWIDEMQSFSWLRDLRAVGGDAGRRRARELVAHWIATYGRWHPTAWRVDLVGARLVAWIIQYEFFCASADDTFRQTFFHSLWAQARHLSRAAPSGASGARLLRAAKGLIFAGLSLPDFEEALAKGLKILQRELPRQITPDGCHVERSPMVQLAVLRDLIDLRAALLAGQVEIPEPLLGAIDRMAPMLRLFRHGDGGLALFNGSNEGEPWAIDLVLNQTGAKSKPLTSATHGGFQRLAAGRTLVVADTGMPSPPGVDDHLHAGTLSFEMSVGKERMVVNCGTHASGSPDWLRASRATAAHSTVAIDDTNSVEIRDDGRPGRRPENVTCHREEMEGNILVDASHDGYLPNLGVIHRRRLFLAASGDDFRGEDTLTGPAGRAFTVRFHLHPQVQVSPVQNGAAVLLRLPSGKGWKLRTAGGALDIRESVYLGLDGEPRRCDQIVVSGTLGETGTVVKWAFSRVDAKPAGAAPESANRTEPEEEAATPTSTD